MMRKFPINGPSKPMAGLKVFRAEMRFDYPYDVVISHGPGCIDGMMAAATAFLKLPSFYQRLLFTEGGIYTMNPKPLRDGETHINSVEGAIGLQKRGYPVVFAFAQPGDNISADLVQGKRVLVMDLDLGAGLLPLVQASASVMLLDHHASSADTIKNPELSKYLAKFKYNIITTKDESGASLAWKLFHPNEDLPELVDIVRMNDNWDWDKDTESKPRAVIKYLSSKKEFRSFPAIAKLYETWDQELPLYTARGEIMVDYEESIVRRAAKQVEIGFIQTNDGKIYTIAYANAPVLHSEIGSKLREYASKRQKNIDFCATWKYAPYKSIVSVSLRDPSTGIDLSTIARNISGESRGGGGHGGAASFSFYGIENLHKFLMKEHPIESQKPVIQNPFSANEYQDNQAEGENEYYYPYPRYDPSDVRYYPQQSYPQQGYSPQGYYQANYSQAYYPQSESTYRPPSPKVEQNYQKVEQNYQKVEQKLPITRKLEIRPPPKTTF